MIDKMKLKEYKYNSVNPFIDGVMEHLVDKKYRKAAGKSIQHVIDEHTGEVKAQSILVLGEQKQMDKQQYCKVYIGKMRQFFNLSKSAAGLVDYIMENITYSSDRICLYPADIMDKLTMGKTTYYRSITQLLDEKLIAKADNDGCYYINPAVMFKGDRITLITQYINKDAIDSKLLQNKNNKPIKLLNETTGEVH